MSTQTVRYWCVNFDPEAPPLGGKPEDWVLSHGLKSNLWLMQYQYAHHGHGYQSHKRPGVITRNWNAARGIRVGDWCAAYMPPCRFYAVGKVILPRKPRTKRDTLKRMQKDKCHIYFDETVRYIFDETVRYIDALEDASEAFYEDFTDEWDLRLNNRGCESCRKHPGQFIEVWRYPQRVDVEEWKHQVLEGVRISGLTRGVRGSYRSAAFQVSEGFFEEIRGRLRSEAGE